MDRNMELLTQTLLITTSVTKNVMGTLDDKFKIITEENNTLKTKISELERKINAIEKEKRKINSELPSKPSHGRRAKSDSEEESEKSESESENESGSEGEESDPTEPPVPLPAGKGIPLGQINTVNSSLSQFQVQHYKLLHQYLYGQLCLDRNVKRNVKKFKGYEWSIGSSEYKAKLEETTKMELKQLRTMCKMLDLDKKGSASELSARLVGFLQKPNLCSSYTLGTGLPISTWRARARAAGLRMMLPRRPQRRLLPSKCTTEPTEPPVPLPAGKGIPLGQINTVNSSLSQFQVQHYKLLHQYLYGQLCLDRNVKRNVKKFKGYEWSIGSSEYKAKLEETTKMEPKQLWTMCEMLGLDEKGPGSASELSARLVGFLQQPGPNNPHVRDELRARRPPRRRSSIPTAARDDVPSRCATEPTDSPVTVPAGKGLQLGYIPNVEIRLWICGTRAENRQNLKLLHQYLYGQLCLPRNVRRNVKKFCGYEWSIGSSEYKAKLEETTKMEPKQLWTMCEMLGLDNKGSVLELSTRLVDFLQKPNDNIGKRVRVGGKFIGYSEKEYEVDQETQVEGSKPDKDGSEDSDEPKSERGRPAPPVAKGHKGAVAKNAAAKATPVKRKAPTPPAKKKAPTGKAAGRPAKKASSDQESGEGSEEDEDETSDDEESGDESDTPADKKAKRPPTDDEIKKYVKQILEGANLDQMTMKTVCKQVYSHYPDFDLVHKKDFIKAAVKSII